MSDGATYFLTPPLTIIDRPADARHLGPPRSMAAIKIMILHATAGPLQSSLDWLTTNPASSVSVHRLIDRDGTIYKLADDDRVCNHVGFSRMGNTTNLNPFSLGIELVNRNDGRDPYPHAQLRSTAFQVAEWYGRYGMLPIVSHASVDTKGKSDPAGFPWAIWYQLLIDQLRVLL